MIKTILITRPRYDEPTNYLYYWAGLIIKEAQKKNYRVLDLDGQKANLKDFSGRIKKTQPELVVLNGHGSVDTIAGHDGQVLLSVDKNESLLSNKISYALACSSAKKLGKCLIEKGAKSFIGYEEDFIFLHEKDKLSRPINDKTAGLFLEPSNLVASTLIKGNTAKEAYDRSQKEFRHNIRRLVVSESPQEDKSPITWLYWDMIHQVCLGDNSAKI